jgi:hypothetical protein
MRKWFPILVFGLVMGAGCSGSNLFSKRPAPGFDDAAVGAPSARPKQKNEAKGESNKPAELIVTPGNSLTGRVMRYNDAGRFVVLDFPLGHSPQVEQRMFIYRGGLKVGEVKISEWQRENLVVADLTTGEAQEGDEVRNK